MQASRKAKPLSEAEFCEDCKITIRDKADIEYRPDFGRYMCCRCYECECDTWRVEHNWELEQMQTPY